MADLNEPKKETERIGLPAAAGAKPPTGSLRPPAAPRLPPPKEEVAAGPPARPTTQPSAPAASGAARPPTGPPPPTSAKASIRPLPPLGPIPPSPSPVVSPGAPGPSKPGLSPINRPLENRDLLHAGSRQESARGVDSPMKAAVKPGSVHPGSVPLVPIIRAASPTVANSPAKGLGALAPAQLCWALLGTSVLSLLLQLWNYFF
jgi:hypothetical protein